jgi:hypothetical protein
LDALYLVLEFDKYARELCVPEEGKIAKPGCSVQLFYVRETPYGRQQAYGITRATIKLKNVDGNNCEFEATIASIPDKTAKLKFKMT